MDEKTIAILTEMTDEDDENVLSYYWDNAASIILNHLYPYIDWDDEESEISLTVPKRYNGLQIRMCAYMLNKRGAEGELQHNENNVFRYYGSADIPKDLLNEITPFGGIL